MLHCNIWNHLCANKSIGVSKQMLPKNNLFISHICLISICIKTIWYWITYMSWYVIKPNQPHQLTFSLGNTLYAWFYCCSNVQEHYIYIYIYGMKLTKICLDNYNNCYCIVKVKRKEKVLVFFISIINRGK